MNSPLQSELQLLYSIIPEKFQRSVYDNIVQPGLDAVVTEGEVCIVTGAKHMTNDFCFVDVMEAAILKILLA